MNDETSKNKKLGKEKETIEEIVGQDFVGETKNQKQTMIGIIVDCLCLALRNDPSINSAIIKTIDAGSEVTIHNSKSTNDFYSVVTDDGISGFCKKSFVKIK